MFLGTRRVWWIAAGLCFLLGLVFSSTEIGGGLGNVAGVLLILLAMVIFAAAPMRYGQGAKSAAERPAPAPPVEPAAKVRPRVHIDAGDASEV